MKSPDVSNVIKDPEDNITFNVKAYRKLSTRELIRTVNNYTMTHKKPVRGTTVTIVAPAR